MQWCCLSHTQWRWARSHVCCERRISQSPITPTRGSAVPSPASQNPWELILLTLDCAIFSRNAHDRSPDVSLWLSLSWWHLLCHPGVQEGLSPVLSSPTLVMLHIWPRRLQLEMHSPDGWIRDAASAATQKCYCKIKRFFSTLAGVGFTA